MPVMPISKLQDTTLWKKLNGFKGADKDIAKTLANNLIGICQEAYDRMRNFPSLHAEYTLHDAVHLLRVTELMSKIIPTDVLKQLNPIEIALLILSAHFHDQGMVLDANEISDLDSDKKFRAFQDTWEIEHHNLKELRRLFNNEDLSDIELKRLRKVEFELEGALLTDYVRITHGDRSAKFVQRNFTNDPRWEISGTNFAELTAKLCKSHIHPASELTSKKGFQYDESVGTYQVNMVYLGLILRLADILDFDRDRTPDSLYRTIDFRSQISLAEWEKHRSVEGWSIKPNTIRFTMKCEHPEYQRAAYQFMNWIDKELTDAQALVRDFPESVVRYKLNLPLTVDRSRIEPKDEAYIYHDLEFSLSRDEIVKLLMTNELYGSSSLCVRELLQNGLDALRYRRALIKRDNGTEWQDGKILMEHKLNEHGHEIIRCIDNGIGMDETIIKQFLTKAGRSFYRSPEFEQERISFRAVGVDFDPCAQFGIGFMSCFMLGDRITVHTRRDYGPSRGLGKPLVVEINGLGGIVVIRQGTDEQPAGTIVEIVGRKKPRLLDEWSDKVKLVTVLRAYARACEFPIRGDCSISEITEFIDISPKIATLSTYIEKADIRTYTTLEQEFSEIDLLLGGSIRSSFLINEVGKFTLENNEMIWKLPPESPPHFGSRLVDINGETLIDDSFREDSQTCLDGILVAGNRHQDIRDLSLSLYSNPIRVPSMSFVLDIRGQIKPPLSPARTPPSNIHNSAYGMTPRWEFIQTLVNKASGRIWEKVAEKLNSEKEAELFWQLSIIYGISRLQIEFMRAKHLFNIYVPIIFENGTHEWLPLTTLGRLEIKGVGKKQFQLLLSNGAYIGAYDMLTKWLPKNTGKTSLEAEISRIVALQSTIIIQNSQYYLELRSPVDPEIFHWEFVVRGFDQSLLMINYSHELKDYISVHTPMRSVNREHPLVKIAKETKYLESCSEFQEFAKDIIWFLSDPNIVENNSESQRINKWRKEISGSYSDVQWSNIAVDLHPPYKIRLSNGDTLEITGDDLNAWADL